VCIDCDTFKEENANNSKTLKNTRLVGPAPQNKDNHIKTQKGPPPHTHPKHTGSEKKFENNQQNK
jgi:hypothetical protein